MNLWAVSHTREEIRSHGRSVRRPEGGEKEGDARSEGPEANGEIQWK